jgi:cysteine desulfurase
VEEPGEQGTRRAFLDAASGPMLPAARETLLSALDAGWADPRRLHAEARRARLLLDQARDVLSAGLGVRPSELSFLPGGPSALRAGLEGIAYADRRRGTRLVASAVEHSTVLTWPGLTWAGPSSRPGADNGPVLIPVDRHARVHLDAAETALAQPEVGVAAVQAANGEVGTRQPLAAVRQICQRHDIPLVVDAMSSLGRDPVPTQYDVLAGDARSFGGPPGVGLLVVPERTRWRLPGAPAEGEHGRSDVEPVIALALAAAEAWQQTEAVRQREAAGARRLVDQVRAAMALIPDVEVMGDPVDRLPHVLTFSALYVDGEALVTELDRHGIAVASGSACTSSTLRPSHVLAAMGVLTHGNVRLTLPLEALSPDRAHDVARFIEAAPVAIASVRAQLGAGSL